MTLLTFSRYKNVKALLLLRQQAARLRACLALRARFTFQFVAELLSLQLESKTFCLSSPSDTLPPLGYSSYVLVSLIQIVKYKTFRGSKLLAYKTVLPPISQHRENIYETLRLTSYSLLRNFGVLCGEYLFFSG